MDDNWSAIQRVVFALDAFCSRFEINLFDIKKRIVWWEYLIEWKRIRAMNIFLCLCKIRRCHATTLIDSNRKCLAERIDEDQPRLKTSSRLNRNDQILKSHDNCECRFLWDLNEKLWMKRIIDCFSLNRNYETNRIVL